VTDCQPTLCRDCGEALIHRHDLDEPESALVEACLALAVIAVDRQTRQVLALTKTIQQLQQMVLVGRESGEEARAHG
jgi:hypothetical protein